ncbi:MAG: hypothetical protein KC656_01625 [Myxococcales bacterium]|nr:hypothetical protein [Myxococcales bacterium]
MDTGHDLGDWTRPVHDGVQIDLSPVQAPPTRRMLEVIFGTVLVAAGFTGLSAGAPMPLATLGLGLVGTLLGAAGAGLLVAWLATWPSEVLVTRESTSLRIDVVSVAGTKSQRIALSTVEEVELEGSTVVLRTTDGPVRLPLQGRSRSTRRALANALRGMLRDDVAGAEHVPAALKRVVGQEA